MQYAWGGGGSKCSMPVCVGGGVQNAVCLGGGGGSKCSMPGGGGQNAVCLGGGGKMQYAFGGGGVKMQYALGEVQNAVCLGGGGVKVQHAWGGVNVQHAWGGGGGSCSVVHGCWDGGGKGRATQLKDKRHTGLKSVVHSCELGLQKTFTALHSAARRCRGLVGMQLRGNRSWQGS